MLRKCNCCKQFGNRNVQYFWNTGERRELSVTEEREPTRSSRGTERPVESTLAVHVLSVLNLLFLAHTVDVVPGNFGVLGGSESGEAHRLAHLCLHLILVCVGVIVQIHLVFIVIRRLRTIGLPRIFSRPRISAITLGTPRG